VADLSSDTGIHVSDIMATIQSLGLISVDADSHRSLVLFCLFCRRLRLVATVTVVIVQYFLMFSDMN